MGTRAVIRRESVQAPGLGATLLVRDGRGQSGRYSGSGEQGRAGPGNWRERSLGPWRRLSLPPVSALPVCPSPQHSLDLFWGGAQGPHMAKREGEVMRSPSRLSPSSAPTPQPPLSPQSRGTDRELRLEIRSIGTRDHVARGWPMTRPPGMS